jgi:hypothetical protein
MNTLNIYRICDIYSPNIEYTIYLLQPSYYCDEWKNEVSENPLTAKESTAFKNRPEMTSVIQSVSNRLGFTSSISYGMYVMFRSRV